MPANPRALSLTAQYHDRIELLARRTSVLAGARLPDAESLEQIGEVVPNVAGLVAIGQQAAQSLTRAFVSQLAFLEVEDAAIPESLDDNVGTTADGRAVSEAFIATPAKVLLSLQRGKTPTEALTFARFSTMRLAHTEVMDAAEVELEHLIQEHDQIKGWRWRSRGTCGACLAMDDGRTREPGQALERHPFCQCVAEPIFDVPQRVQRESGHDRFDALSESEQNRILGDEPAKWLREGKLGWGDLVVVQSNEQWRDVVTFAPLEVLRERAGVDESATNVA